MPIRVECDIEDLEHCFVLVADGWTRNEIMQLTQPIADLAELRPLWEKRVIDVHLQTADGAPLTTVVDVFDNIDELDMRLMSMIRGALLQATDYLLDLGKAKKRLSFVGADGVARTIQAPTPTMTTTASTPPG